MPSTRDLTRRRLMGAGLAVLGAATVAACGSDSAGPASAGDAETTQGPWTWTDDLGQTIELERTPVRIAAYGDAAAALWRFGIEPVAIFTWMDPADDPLFEGIDLSTTEIVGSVYGEISLEALAATRPDLVVATTYTGDTPDSMYGFKDSTQLAKVAQIAPVLAVAQVGSAIDVIGTNERLVASLGIDTGDGSRVAQDRAAFQQAAGALTAAASRGLSVVPIHADADGLYYAKAPDDPALAYYQDLGVRFTPIGGQDYYWQTVSWENADRYDPDVFLYSTRDAYDPAELARQPVFARLAALQDGQLHPWESNSMDYPSQTAYMERLAGWLSTDRDIVA